MADQIKPGDVLQLKSGGPKMTVQFTTGEGNWACQWFVGTDLKSGVFPATSLQPYQPKGVAMGAL